MVMIGSARRIKEIKDYPGYYVTSDGYVIGKRKNDFLRTSPRMGYPAVSLVRDGKRKTENIHRLVAIAFIPNPYGYNMVNHKDEDKTNNNVENLEWCDAKYNNNYGTIKERKAKTQRNRKDCSKQVLQYSLDGIFIKEYPSLKEAKRQTGISSSHISECCRHYKNQYTAGGFVWKWKES